MAHGEAALSAPEPPVPVHPTVEVSDDELWLRVALPGRRPEWFRLAAKRRTTEKTSRHERLEAIYQAQRSPVAP